MKLTRDQYLLRAHSMALRGNELGQSKLNDDIVSEIRSAAKQRENMRHYIASNLSNAALAEKHKVHPRTIEKVLSYETWGHI